MESEKRSVMNRSEKFGIVGVRVVIGATLAILFSSCAQMIPGLGKMEDASIAFYPKRAQSVNVTTGPDAFASVVYPIILDSRCTNCHTSQQPTIASNDINIAYAASKTRLSVSSPAASVLVAKATDGHCAGCPSAPKATWIAALDQWAEAEARSAPPAGGGSGGGGGFNEPPVDLGAPPVFVSPTIQLNGAGGNDRVASLAGRGADFGAVDLLYNLQDPYQFVANSARIFNLRLRNNSTRFILVRAIRIFQSVDANVNPADTADYKSDLGAAYLDVDKVIAPGTTISLSVSEALMTKSDGVYFAFGFQALEVTNAPTCKSANVFANTVNTVLTARCTNCHGGTGPGTGAWRFAATAAERCGQSLQRSDLTTPNASKLIQYPFYRQSAHPATGLTQAEVDNIINWITLER
jgi:hypothetical protein